MAVKILKNFRELCQVNRGYSLCLLDIEGTILKDNYYYDALDETYYINRFIDLFNKYNEQNPLNKLSNVRASLYVGKHYRRELSDQFVTKSINLIQKNTMVCALTSGFPSTKKVEKLEQLGINIPILFTSNTDKGYFLKAVLKEFKHYGIEIDSISIVDNHYYKLQSIRRNLEGENIKLGLFLFAPKLEVMTDQAFDNYWMEVFHFIAKNYKAYSFLLEEQKKFQKNFDYKNIIHQMVKIYNSS